MEVGVRAETSPDGEDRLRANTFWDGVRGTALLLLLLLLVIGLLVAGPQGSTVVGTSVCMGVAEDIGMVDFRRSNAALLVA